VTNNELFLIEIMAQQTTIIFAATMKHAVCFFIHLFFACSAKSMIVIHA
jgi:hypothetical protein